MEGEFHLCLMGMGQRAELTQSGESSNTFYHLGETDRLPREKQSTKELNSSSQTCFEVERADNCSHDSSLLDHFSESICTRRLIHQEEPGLKHPELICLKAV
jgi:hypothetical protein